MGSELGLADSKIGALDEYATHPMFNETERAALAYADAITGSDDDVSDELFARVAQYFDPDALVELTAAIAWENASSKFNRALRIGSQGLWKRADGEGAA
ncbi:MAG: hypothetical protein IH877_00850 [Gemmatimonadetes bacterium]|nr:hypothetical protein [Gemmatimonadota bacterium]